MVNNMRIYRSIPKGKSRVCNSKIKGDCVRGPIFRLTLTFSLALSPSPSVHVCVGLCGCVCVCIFGKAGAIHLILHE